MQMTVVYICFLAVFSQGCLCADWASGMKQWDGGEKYACEGKSMTFPWRFTMSPSDSLEDIQWRYQGRSDEMVAIFAQDHFVSFPVFADRVEYVSNAGLTLRHVTVADSGNYSVTVTILGRDGTFQHLEHSVLLDVRDRLMTSDGRLHITENPTAVSGPGQDQWSIQLQCGNFSYSGLPPFSVDWIDPEGHIIPSTAFESNYFTLLLPEPVRGGNYSCRIPVRYYADACLQSDEHEAAEASLFVHHLLAKIKLLEAQKAALENELNTLRPQGAQTPARVYFQADMTPEISTDSGKRQLNDGDVFVFNEVTVNQGDSYSNVTGVFTAPLHGVYHFTAFISSWELAELQQGGGGDVGPPADNLGFCFHVDGSPPDGRYRCVWSPLRAFVMTIQPSLDKGNRVWVEARSSNGSWALYNARLAQFGGFLMEPLP